MLLLQALIVNTIRVLKIAYFMSSSIIDNVRLCVWSIFYISFELSIADNGGLLLF